ncbi:DEAD/DEAH box helicase [Glaciibacter sp. 2TAF33]|uniref:DEAD/DEAH box helicase n=1 Tax=Glaciibacter sp. 2TAF33 TaxID=3233015 RepID=UPI003F8DE234
MSSDAFPLVDMGDIIRLVGKASFDRAQAYARNGAVTALEWDAGEGVLRATVQGSEPRPYHCEIELHATRNGYSKPVDSTCTCPMDWDCKHVAATLLSSNAAHLKQAAGVGGGRPPTETARAPEWKRVVGVVTEPPPTAASRRIPGFANPATFAPALLKPPVTMSLQFEVREEAPRTEERWRGPQIRAAGAADGASGQIRLGVRPVTLGASGKWVRAGLTWNNLIYGVNRMNLNPAQHRWFCQLAALHRATPQAYAGQDPDWCYLDEFNSPLLWPLFAEAVRLGIGFVGSKKDTTVVIGHRADVSLDASTQPGAGLRLTTTLIIDGTAHPSDRAGAIADHGVYSYDLATPSTITLAPTADTLSAEQHRLLGQPPLVTVPAPDVPEFFADFYPALRKTIPVTSTDASVEFPEIAPPELVLTATFLPKHTVRLDWEWEYHDTPVPSRKPLRATIADQHGRDETVEQEALARVTALLRPELLQPTLTVQGVTAAEFTEKDLPRIEALDGVRVDVVGDKPDYRELTAPPTLTVTTVETDQRDWFDLGVIVTIDGKQVPFGPLFKALATGQTKLLLIDHSYLSLQHPAFEQLRELIDEAQSLAEWETGLRISRYQAGLWAEFEDLADSTEQAEGWRAAVSGLNELAALDTLATPTPLPTGLRATLRPYQRDGFNWLTFLWRHELGGILADDMGLGKTLQTLALILHAREQGDDRRPFLVVAPTSVVSNWLTEAARFAPGLTVVGIAATAAKSGTPLTDAALGADVVVTSYALFRLDFDSYQAHGWAGLILDEAQFVKNRAARVHISARDLNAPFKLAITGTPMENNLLELHSLFSIVAPGLFPSARKFTEVYQRPIEGADKGVRNNGEASRATTPNSAELLAKLRRRIRPLMMRRSKELVAGDLPAKQEQLLQIDLEPRHRKLYDTFLQRERQKLLGLIDDMDKNRFIVFRSLTLLRMLSLDASLVDEKYAHVPSSKLDALLEQLDDVVAEGHRALIFSQFTSFLKKAAERLDAQGIAYCYLDGSTLHRSDVIDRFKSGTAPVFLISLKAGGFGLNLTEADYVFLLDPWWNPATEAQAVDRTHRIGQTRNVMVYRMIATGTIEEKVMALKDKKAKLFRSVMDDDAMFSSALTADDIRGLLED